MFTEPKRGNGYRESELCYATKKLGAIVNYYEIYEKITFEYFINHIEKFIKKYEFDWPEPKPGKDKYPKYATAKEWPSKYDYASCVQCFENYQLNFDKNKADSIYDKKSPQDTISDFKNYDAYEEQIQKELSKDNPDPTVIDKWENLKDRCLNRNAKRTGRDVQKFEGKIKSENLNMNIPTTEEALKENEDTISNFLNRLRGGREEN